MANKLKLKRGIHQNLPVLDVGEPAFTTDTKELYIGSATGNILIGSKVDDDTIKLNEYNQIYVNAIAMVKITGLANALGLKVEETRKINNYTLQNDIVLDADDIKVDDATSSFHNKTIQESLEDLEDDIDGIIIPTVPTISTDILNDANSDVKTASPKAVKTYVDNKVASTYKASGSLAPGAISNALLVVGNLGNVYNITGSFTTTADFLEGAGHTHEAGTNIAVVASGGGYKFDVLAAFIDTSSFLTTIPPATSSVLGGVKGAAKGAGDTVEVKIDSSTNKMYVPTYPVNTDTKNTAGSTQDAAKLFVVGAKSQGANPQTYSNSKVYIDGGKVYSDGKVVLTEVPKATNSLIGGIQVNYTTSTPKHKVELDGSGNAFVDLTNLTIDGGEW